MEEKKIIIAIEGMKCEGCMNRVNRVLNTFDEVEMCQVDLHGASITLKEPVSEAKLKEKIESLGFSVTNIKTCE